MSSEESDKSKRTPGQVLRDWLDSLPPDQNVAWLSEKVGKSRATVYNWLKDRYLPERDAAHALVFLANGVFTLDDIYQAPENPLQACRSKAATDQAA